MNDFHAHDETTAPAASQAILSDARQRLGLQALGHWAFQGRVRESAEPFCDHSGSLEQRWVGQLGRHLLEQGDAVED